MALTPSTMLELGTALPSFRLPDFNGNLVSSEQFVQAPGLLVAFICPHCPFVQHVREELGRFGVDYQKRGLAIVGINSNDTVAFPQDGAAAMKEEARIAGYSFPYLVDATQTVAKSFRAACTPDLFLFDRAGRLAYRGQLDGSRPGNGVRVTGEDLRAAADAILSGATPVGVQKPSVGCNIKWKAGGEPDYAR